MLKFFRNQRFTFLKEGKFINYLKYAFGEIVLVVIGILIAVNINNWNESRKQKNLKQTIYKIVEDEMISDSLAIYQSLPEFKSLDSIFNKILSNQMSKEEYISCELCANIVGIHNPHSFKTKGYEMLANYVESQNDVKDTLSGQILEFYNQIGNIMEVINEYSKQDVRDNLKSWKENYNWFYLDHKDRINDEEYLNYLVNHADFKNRVAMQKVLVIKNKKEMLVIFNKNAKILLPKIQEKINPTKR